VFLGAFQKLAIAYPFTFSSAAH